LCCSIAFVPFSFFLVLCGCTPNPSGTSFIPCFSCSGPAWAPSSFLLSTDVASPCYPNFHATYQQGAPFSTIKWLIWSNILCLSPSQLTFRNAMNVQVCELGTCKVSAKDNCWGVRKYRKSSSNKRDTSSAHICTLRVALVRTMFV